MIEYTNLEGQRCYVAASHVVRLTPSIEGKPECVWLCLTDGSALQSIDPIEVLAERYDEQSQADAIAIRIQPLIDARVQELAGVITNAMGRAAGRISTR